MVYHKLSLIIILFMVVNVARPTTNSLSATKAISNEMILIDKNDKLTTKSINLSSSKFLGTASSVRKSRRRMLTQEKFHSNPRKGLKSRGRSFHAPAEPSYDESLIVKGIRA